ncbi:alpha/beta fold hydrolase [Streptomyces sp. NPDC052043]|uniref:alpha/beta fold hydrolase n=1 Tax=Streptomyces sp. NPDC052043 TaxID=3365684 RepID=UPI0037D201A5
MTDTTSHSDEPVTGRASANGIELYYELRGAGTPLLMIPGAGGDGGTYAAVAGLLAEHFTVITYDRRGNSRSGRPPAWSATSPDEQADDAAALLRALRLAPAHVFGSSSGATITLNLALRHPEVVRSAVAHEPPKIGVMPERDELLALLRERAEAARQRGGYRASMADFSGWLTGTTREREHDLAERTLGNGEVWVTRELGVVDRWDPPAGLTADRRVPVTVAVGSEGGTDLHQELLGRYRAALEELAAGIGAAFTAMPGGHVPYATHIPAFLPRLTRLLTEAESGTANRT